MKARTVPIALGLAALAAWGALSYRPPLIGGGGPVGRIYDIGAFGWWYARSAWSREGWARTPDPVLAARAAWHRPGMARELLGVSPGDLPALGRRYFSLGLSGEAAALFSAAAEREPSFAATAAAYLAALGDWDRVRETAAALAGPAGAYWRGRALEESGDPAAALEELSRVGEGPFRADAAARSGALREGRGDRERALSLYRRALELAPLDRAALAGVARIGTGPEAAAAARTLAAFARSLPLRVPVGDRFLLLGADVPSGPVLGGARSRIGLTLLGWAPGPEGSEVLPLAGMIAEEGMFPWYQGGAAFSPPGPGELREAVLDWDWPLEVFPGNVDLGVAFETLPGEERLPAAAGRGDYIGLARLRLVPAWVPSPVDGSEVEACGPGAARLNRAVFLGPGDRIRWDFPGPRRARGLAVISSVRSRGPGRAGDRVGTVGVETAGGTAAAAPLRLGRETAGATEGPASGVPVSGVRKGSGSRELYDYRAVVRFPETLEVEAVNVENVSRSSGLKIAELVLIEDAGSGPDPEPRR